MAIAIRSLSKHSLTGARTVRRFFCLLRVDQELVPLLDVAECSQHHVVEVKLLILDDKLRVGQFP